MVLDIREIVVSKNKFFLWFHALHLLPLRRNREDMKHKPGERVGVLENKKNCKF
jgi:hypothetical protein